MEIIKVHSLLHHKVKVVDKDGILMAIFYGESEQQAKIRATVFFNACHAEVGNFDKMISIKNFF
jgi:hypothetical protein